MNLERRAGLPRYRSCLPGIQVHSFGYSYVCCGSHPKTLVYDGVTQKLAFNFTAECVAVENEPDKTVDAHEFWQNVQKEIFARGVVDSRVYLNPYHVQLSNWVSYIRPHSR